LFHEPNVFEPIIPLGITLSGLLLEVIISCWAWS
jgi:hypothetical protein